MVSIGIVEAADARSESSTELSSKADRSGVWSKLTCGLTSCSWRGRWFTLVAVKDGDNDCPATRSILLQTDSNVVLCVSPQSWFPPKPCRPVSVMSVSVENDENEDDVDDINVVDDGRDGGNSMPVDVDRPNTNTPLVAGTVNLNAGVVGDAKTNAELGCTPDRAGRDRSFRSALRLARAWRSSCRCCLRPRLVEHFAGSVLMDRLD